jgi:hypothetical protein
MSVHAMARERPRASSDKRAKKKKGLVQWSLLISRPGLSTSRFAVGSVTWRNILELCLRRPREIASTWQLHLVRVVVPLFLETVNLLGSIYRAVFGGRGMYALTIISRKHFFTQKICLFLVCNLRYKIINFWSTQKVKLWKQTMYYWNYLFLPTYLSFFYTWIQLCITEN